MLGGLFLISKTFIRYLTNQCVCGILLKVIEVWLSLVERYVRDVEVVGSNPVTSTKNESSPMDCFFVFGTMCSASGT